MTVTSSERTEGRNRVRFRLPIFAFPLGTFQCIRSAARPKVGTKAAGGPQSKTSCQKNHRATQLLDQIGRLTSFPVFVALTLAAGAPLSAQSSQKALPATVLYGIVIDAATNKPIPKAFVSATRSALPPLRQTVQSAADGSFVFSGLPAATYGLCVQTAGDGYLDPCVWSPPGPTVALSAGQTSTGSILKIQPGSVLKIHLDDPGQLLNQTTKAGYLPHLLMAVRTPQSTLYPAHKVAATAKSVDYQITVPFDQTLVFLIQSSSLQLTDSHDVALANNTAQQTFKQAAGAASPVAFSYTIVGVQP